ncbi:MAG: acyl carrier protein [Candidatus Margulisbacteria bacterium]|nr:acyl carrier protein [Candidatus Margulisiibacteriota bacterium]
MDIKQNLKDYIAKSFKAKIADNDNLFSIGALDSLGIMSLVQHIEEVLSVTLDPEDITADNFESLNNIEKLVTSKVRV